MYNELGLRSLSKVHCKMSKMGKTHGVEQGNHALGMREPGLALTDVARNIGVSHNTISRPRTRFNATVSFKDCPRKLLSMKKAILR